VDASIVSINEFIFSVSATSDFSSLAGGIHQAINRIIVSDFGDVWVASDQNETAIYCLAVFWVGIGINSSRPEALH
jgi:hypothetical protein